MDLPTRLACPNCCKSATCSSQLRFPRKSSAPDTGSSARKVRVGADPNTPGNSSSRFHLRFEAFSLRVVWCCVPVRTGNASKRGAPVVGPTVLVGHRLKARCGRLQLHCKSAALFSRGHSEPRRRSSLSWGGQGRKDGLMFRCRWSVLLGWCSGLCLSLDIPSRTESPTVRGETICFAECSTRPL